MNTSPFIFTKLEQQPTGKHDFTVHDALCNADRLVGATHYVLCKVRLCTSGIEVSLV